jgi:predicted dithiol-disulfide oxidoreductase (DUF899 family)
MPKNSAKKSRKTSANAKEIARPEKDLVKQHQRLAKLKREAGREKVVDYKLRSAIGAVRLSQLFGTHSNLLVVHNMGQSCRYCTMWADGFNGIYPYLANRAILDSTVI